MVDGGGRTSHGQRPHSVSRAGGADTSRVLPDRTDSGERSGARPQQRLDYARVWPLSQGQGVTVAVIDTGVDAGQAQLAGRVEDGFDVVHGSGAANSDCVGHGTFVAGLIAAGPRPGVGFAGLAPAAVILPIRQTDADQDGTAGGLAAGIRLAADHGASVINISLASTVPSTALDAAVAYAESRNALIVAAAANDAQSGNPRTYRHRFPPCSRSARSARMISAVPFPRVAPSLTWRHPAAMWWASVRAVPGS